MATGFIRVCTAKDMMRYEMPAVTIEDRLIAAKAVIRSGEKSSIEAAAVRTNHPPRKAAAVRAISTATVGKAASTMNLETSNSRRVEDRAVTATSRGEGTRRRVFVTSSLISTALIFSRKAGR